MLAATFWPSVWSSCLSRKLSCRFGCISVPWRHTFFSETKQRTLEELDQIFSVPVGVFAKYQLTEWLPWFFKRYLLFQKGATLRPLYKVGDELDVLDSSGHITDLPHQEKTSSTWTSCSAFSLAQNIFLKMDFKMCRYSLYRRSCLCLWRLSFNTHIIVQTAVILVTYELNA